MRDDPYVPSGEIQGDSSDLPDRGCTTGLLTPADGLDLSVDATHSEGRFDARSDAPFALTSESGIQSTVSGEKLVTGEGYCGCLGGVG